MKKFLFLFFIIITGNAAILAQPGDSLKNEIVSVLNQKIDNLVVEKNTGELSELYANDFVFSHGSGRVDNKTSWLQSVARGNFISRQHDSVTVEMHYNLAIVRGILTVEKKNGELIDRYYLKYVRVYLSKAARYQMISHFTYWEYHEPKEK